MTIRFKSLTRFSALLLASSALASPAFAQIATPQDAADATAIDEIVVTGQRAATRAAIAVKRDRKSVV